MKQNIYVLFVAVLALGILLGACGQQVEPVPSVVPEEELTEEPAQKPTEEPAPEMMIITDGLGNTIELAKYPQSIVSLSASTTEILFAIGAGNQVVGRDEYSLYPDEALAVTNVGALYDELPTEAILALDPDLVVAADIISEDQVMALLDLGLNVYWQADPTTYEELWGNLRNFAQLTGHEQQTETLIADLETRVETIQEKISSVTERPSVFYELDATDPSNPWTTGSGTFIDYIIIQAGGTNAASALEGDYAQISTEALIAVNPDVILLADAPYGVTPEIVAARSGWGAITAVAENSLYPIDPNMMSVPGPRLVDALEVTASLLHPELFE